MTSIDRRVVEMGFDNKNFETNVQTSLKSLDSLKKGLDLDASAKSLSNLAAAGRSFSLEGISTGVKALSDRFSTMGIIGMTVIQNLTTAAMHAGEKILSSLLNVDSIKKGFREYETQTNAIQTVLANTKAKGTTLPDVVKALDELNTYSDKTIYNFTEMTKNIGTFTAAGVDLKTSVASIKGIANLAAVSGANSEKAAMAMYQLSQALASGTVKLMDWNSVVNAGMGGQVFQDALKETARVHGVKIDDMIKKEGSFRETLQNGWLTSGILTETLSKFTGDLTKDQLKAMGYTDQQIAQIIELGQTANDAATKVKTLSQLQTTVQEAIESGWAKTWQIVIGDFDEAKALFTSISDFLGKIVGDSAASRNNLLQGWKDLGGRTFLLETLGLAFSKLLAIIEPIKEAFREIFPPITANQLVNLTLDFYLFIKSIEVTSQTLQSVKNIFIGFFSIFDIAGQVLSYIAGKIGGLLSSMNIPSGASSFISFLENVARQIYLFSVSLKALGVEGMYYSKRFDGIRAAVESVSNVFKKFQDLIDQVRFKFALFSLSMVSSGMATKMGGDGPFSGLTDFLEKLNVRFEPLLKIAGFIEKALSSIWEAIKQYAPLIGNFLGFLGKVIGDGLTKIFGNLQKVDFSNGLDALNAGLFAGLLLSMKKFVDNGSGVFKGASGMLGSITGVLNSVRGSLEAWQNSVKAKTIMTIALAIAILAASLIALSLVDSGKLTVALAAVTAMFAELMGSMAIMDKIPGGAKNIGGMSTQMLILAAAIGLLTISVIALSKLNAKQLAKGLLAIETLLLELASFTIILSKTKSQISQGAFSLILLAIALEILVDVVKKLGEMKLENLGKGIVALGVMLLELAGFMVIAKKAGMSIGNGISLLIIAGAITVLGFAVEKFAAMDTARLIQGVAAIGGILLAIGIFSRLTGNGLNLMAVSAGLVILGGAMLLFAESIARMGNMSWESLGRGLAGMAGALILVVGAMHLMPKNMLVNAVALVAVGEALILMSNALVKMGGMSWEDLAKGLIAMAGSMAILVISLNLMKGTIPGAAALLIAAGALWVLAGVLQVLGSMSWEAIVKGLVAIGLAFVIFGIAGYALGPIIPVLLGLSAAMLLFGVAAAALGLGVLMFATGIATLVAVGTGAVAIFGLFLATLISFIPQIAAAIANGIIVFAQVIAQGAPAIAEAFTTLLLEFINVVGNVAPQLFTTVKTLLLGLINVAVEVIPEAIAAVMLLITSLLQSIANSVPQWVQAGMDMLIGFLSGIANNIGKVVAEAVRIVTEFLKAIGLEVPKIIKAGFDMIISLIDGITDAIKNDMPRLNTAIANLAKAIIDGLVDGVKKGVGAVGEAVKNLAIEALKAFGITIQSNSPSKAFYKYGEYIDQGLVNGIRDNMGAAGRATRDLGKSAISNLSEAIAGISNIVSSSWDLTPTIRPVVDLSDVKKGGREIGGLLGTSGISVSSAANRAASISTGTQSESTPTSQVNPVTKETSVTFHQYNYSPNALSAVDIYRQTRNQLIQAKGLVPQT